MFCSNCRKPIRFGTMPYCGCRFYNARQLSYFIVKTVNRKILIRQPLWVIAQSGTVGLVSDGIEVCLRREAGGISVTFNGERMGRAEYISLPPFVEKLLKLLTVNEVRREHRVTVIARRAEAAQVLSVPGAKLRGVENGKATISIPL